MFFKAQQKNLINCTFNLNYELNYEQTNGDYLDSFQYAAASNFGNTNVAFNKRAMPTPSQNCKHHKQFKKIPKQHV